MKQKRKAQPINLKRYWIGFSLLAILLLIPFRIVGYWMLTNFLYILSINLIGFVILQFIQRYRCKRQIVILMTICLLLPLFQIYQNSDLNHSCTHDDSNNMLLQSVTCDDGGICYTDFIILRDTPLGVQTQLFPEKRCIWWGLF